MGFVIVDKHTEFFIMVINLFGTSANTASRVENKSNPRGITAVSTVKVGPDFPGYFSRYVFLLSNFNTISLGFCKSDCR